MRARSMTGPRHFATLLALAGLAWSQPPAERLRFKPVAFAVLEDYDKGDDLNDVARDFALMRELDVRTWRGSFGWDDFEPAPGRSDFAWLERFAARARREGMTLRPYIGYTPQWAGGGGRDGDAWNDPPRSLDAWATFVRALAGVLRKHRNVVSLEIYNEENVAQWWDGTAEQYRDVLQRAADAIDTRRFQLLPGGLVFPDVDFIETACGGAGRRLAAIALHAYPETWTPPEVTVETYLGDGFEAFLKQADESCGAKPIWINETGFATTPGRSEQAQASWWARAVATFLAHPRVEQIGIYEIKDLAPGRAAIGDAPNYHLGLTSATRRKKAAFATVDLLTDLLDTGRLAVADASLRVETAAMAATVERHLFVRPDGRQVAFIWLRPQPAAAATPRAITATLHFSRPARAAIAYELDGRRAAVPFAGGTLAGVTLRDGDVRIFELR